MRHNLSEWGVILLESCYGVNDLVLCLCFSCFVDADRIAYIEITNDITRIASLHLFPINNLLSCFLSLVEDDVGRVHNRLVSQSDLSSVQPCIPTPIEFDSFLCKSLYIYEVYRESKERHEAPYSGGGCKATLVGYGRHSCFSVKSQA